MTSIDTAKHYYAFISHSTADEKMAIWLRKQLINYNIPARCVQRNKCTTCSNFKCTGLTFPEIG